MNKLFLISLFVTITFNCISQEYQSNVSANTNIDSLFQQHLKNQSIVGAAAGYSINGQTKWQSVSGYANRENQMLFNVNTKVRMASIAKPMTAIAIMQLLEKSLIDLDIAIQEYVPDLPEHIKTKITVRHLLSHTSGIDGYKNAKEAENQKNYPSLADAVDVFKNRYYLNLEANTHIPLMGTLCSA